MYLDITGWTLENPRLDCWCYVSHERKLATTPFITKARAEEHANLYYDTPGAHDHMTRRYAALYSK